MRTSINLKIKGRILNLEIKERLLLDFARANGFTEDELACIHEDEYFKDELCNILEGALKSFCYC